MDELSKLNTVDSNNVYSHQKKVDLWGGGKHIYIYTP